jgi:hypothetical protein
MLVPEASKKPISTASAPSQSIENSPVVKSQKIDNSCAFGIIGDKHKQELARRAAVQHWAAKCP